MLILLDVVTDHALLRGYFKQLCHVHQPDTLNIDRTTQLVSHVISMRVHFLDLCLLGEIIRVHHVFNARLLPPFNEVGEHELNRGEVELPSAAEPQQIVIIINILAISFSSDNPLSELF